MQPINVVIEAPLLVAHISPLGFHQYSHEFLRAAQNSNIQGSFSPVPYFLICRSIELSLKAFLLAKGFQKEKLRYKNLGHDLEKILNKAISMDLEIIVPLTPQYRDELQKANEYYASKQFEYFDDIYKAMTGYPNLPNISVLTALATLLVTKLEPVCLQA